MAPPKQHLPPAIAWRTPPAGAAQPFRAPGAALTTCASGADLNPRASGTAQAMRASGTAQAMRAFTPHQRPQGNREAAVGDELVNSANGQFQLRRHDNHVLTRPSGVYNFVRVQGATRNQTATMLSARAPHASLAAGQPVLYAGTVAFDSGQLQWWSNYSGTYQPQAEFHRQAALPGEKFVPWQKLQMGGVGLQRGMLTDHRGIDLPALKGDKPAKEEKPGNGASASPAPAPQRQPAKADDKA